MTKREIRVVNAFVDCVKNGEYSYGYATTLLEANDKYGYLTDEAKEVFYNAFESKENIAQEVIIPHEITDDITDDITDSTEPTVDDPVDTVTKNVEVTEEGAEDGQADTEVTESE